MRTELDITCRMPWHPPTSNDSGSSAACVDGGDRRPTCVDDRERHGAARGGPWVLAAANGLRFQDVTRPAHLMAASFRLRRRLQGPRLRLRLSAETAPCSRRDPASQLATYPAPPIMRSSQPCSCCPEIVPCADPLADAHRSMLAGPDDALDRLVGRPAGVGVVVTSSTVGSLVVASVRDPVVCIRGVGRAGGLQVVTSGG